MCVGGEIKDDHIPTHTHVEEYVAYLSPGCPYNSQKVINEMVTIFRDNAFPVHLHPCLSCMLTLG